MNIKISIFKTHQCVVLLAMVIVFGLNSVAVGATKNAEIMLDTDGRSISAIQPIVGNSLSIRVAGLLEKGECLDLYYEFGKLQTLSDPVGNLSGMLTRVTVLGANSPETTANATSKNNSCAVLSEQTAVTNPVTIIIPPGQEALYYYLVKTRKEGTAPDVLEGSAIEKAFKTAQENVSAKQASVDQLSANMKAYAGMSTPVAAEGVRDLIVKLDAAQVALDMAKKNLEKPSTDYDNLKKKIEDDTRKQNPRVVLRVGVVPISGHDFLHFFNVDDRRKPVFYNFKESENKETPFRLERMADFPVFTVADNLYIVIVNHRRNQKPADFVLSYGTEKGAVIDIAPVRPSFDVPTVSKNALINLAIMAAVPPSAPPDATYAYVDRVLAFANKLPGEGVPTVSVSSYATVVTQDKVDTGKATLVTETKTVKVLDSEKWPQVHSLYHFSLSTGVVASWLRDPSFSRVLTDLGVPADSTATPPAAAVPAKYKTASDPGSIRAIPVMAFSAYILPRDIQVPWKPIELLPAPTVGFSLTSPADNFFFGGSSEIARNVQLIYGYHYGRITALAPTGIDDPTSNTAPPTTKRFHGNKFVGLTFNVNFIKDLFK